MNGAFWRALMVLAALSQWQRAGAQASGSGIISAPLRQFPIGARLRLSVAGGGTHEGALALVTDSTIWLRTSGQSHRQIDVSDIQTLEVHTAPKSRKRTTMVSAGIGGLVGAVAGAAAYGDARASAGYGSAPSRAETVAGGAVWGAAIGWALGRFVIARSTWQLVRWT